MNVTEKPDRSVKIEKSAERKSCCFVDLTLKIGMTMSDKVCEEKILKSILKPEVEKQIVQNEISHFYCITDCGAALCALEVAIALKEQHPHILVEAMIPYEEQHVDWSEYTRERYFSAIASSDIENMSAATSIDEGMYKFYKEAIHDSDSIIYIHGRYPDYKILAFDNYTY